MAGEVTAVHNSDYATWPTSFEVMPSPLSAQKLFRSADQIIRAGHSEHHPITL
jgi:hypothetical protein